MEEAWNLCWWPVGLEVGGEGVCWSSVAEDMKRQTRSPSSRLPFDPVEVVGERRCLRCLS